MERGSFRTEPRVHHSIGAIVEDFTFESFVGVVAVLAAAAGELGLHEHQLQFVGLVFLFLLVGVVLFDVFYPLFLVISLRGPA